MILALPHRKVFTIPLNLFLLSVVCTWGISNSLRIFSNDPDPYEKQFSVFLKEVENSFFKNNVNEGSIEEMSEEKSLWELVAEFLQDTEGDDSWSIEDQEKLWGKKQSTQ